MSSTPPLCPFPDAPESVQHVSVVLPEPASPSANFPNPNTHRFPVIVAIYTMPKPTAPGTGCLTSLAPLLETIDCSPVQVPLPPSPPPKDTPPIYGRGAGRPIQQPPPNVPPPRVPYIPPSRTLPLSATRRPSAPLHPIPSTAFHGPPTLPRQSALRPLNPRPLYDLRNSAPPSETCSNRKTQVSAMAHRRRRCCSWTAGIITFLVGLILFAVGVTFAAMNALNDSSLTSAEHAVNIAAVVLSIVGFGSLTGSTTHLLWLFRGRLNGVRYRIRDSDIEEKSSRENEPLDRVGSKLGRAGESLSAAGRGMLGKGEDKGDIELLPLSSHRGRVLQKDSSSSSSGSPTPTNPRRTHAAFEDIGERPKSKQPRRRKFGPGNGSKVSFLDLEDPNSETSLDRRMMDDVTFSAGNSTQSRTPAVGASQSKGTRSSSRDRSSNLRAPYDTPGYQRREHNLRTNPSKADASVEELEDERMRSIVQYTASLDRLDKALRLQRYGAVSPSPDNKDPQISALAARARADIAAALGPAIYLNDTRAPNQSKGKQKAERFSVRSEISDGVVVSGQLTGPSKIRLPSSFSAANHPFPFATSSSTSLVPPGSFLHLRSSSDSQLPRPTISLHPSSSIFHLKPPAPTLPNPEPTDDLLQRISRAHRLAETRAAGIVPPASEDSNISGQERFSGPLLPATVYSPISSSIIKPIGLGGAAATTAVPSRIVSKSSEGAPTPLAAPPITPAPVAASTASASGSPLQSSELASDRETWARRKRSMDRRWSQEWGVPRAMVRPLFRSMESDEDRGV